MVSEEPHWCGLNCVSSKDEELRCPASANVSSFGKKISDIVKLRCGHIQIGQVLIQNDWCHKKRRILCEDRDTGRVPCGSRGRDGGEAATSHGSPGQDTTPRSHKRQGSILAHQRSVALLTPGAQMSSIQN